METNIVNQIVKSKFNEMVNGNNPLFELNIDKDVLWETYLNAFNEKDNPIFNERRVYDCNSCKQFVRRVGNVVAIINNELVSVWDINPNNDVYNPVFEKMATFVRQHSISSAFFSTEKEAGVEVNYGELNGKVETFHHLHVTFPDRFVFSTNSSVSAAEKRGSFNSSKSVFKRGLDELTDDSVLTVLDLINQNSLYKGFEWKERLTTFLNLKKEYNKLTEEQKELFAWSKVSTVDPAISGIRNTSMGTLLIDLSADMDLETAVVKYGKTVDPLNYKQPKAIFTAKMIEDAQKTIKELGYLNSLGRRFAKLEDITINNIMFVNRDAAKVVQDALNVFDELQKSLPLNPKKFNKVEEITIDDFINNVLPTLTSLEAFVENKHTNNFVSLIAPKDLEAPSMFKWNNAFSWAYAGNITDSLMKQNVKAEGGNVNGVLRFSIQWNDNDKYDGNDLDAHCVLPNGREIYYADKIDRYSSGSLDVDIVHPDRNKAAVENIVFTDLDKMPEGDYEFFVRCFSQNGGHGGFRAEIECNGEILEFNHNHSLRNKEDVVVAVVNYSRSNGFTVKTKLDSTSSSKEVWGLQTNNFVPVTVAMHSPNYWDEQVGIGNKHYFFMLVGCENPDNPNGFYNEFLKSDLDKHKRVFQALGSKMSVETIENQLSGLGFSSTKRSELIVKAVGSTERMLKIKF